MLSADDDVATSMTYNLEFCLQFLPPGQHIKSTIRRRLVQSGAPLVLHSSAPVRSENCSLESRLYYSAICWSEQNHCPLTLPRFPLSPRFDHTFCSYLVCLCCKRIIVSGTATMAINPADEQKKKKVPLIWIKLGEL